MRRRPEPIWTRKLKKRSLEGTGRTRSFAKNTSAHDGSFSVRIVESNAGHPSVCVFRFVRLLFSGHQAVAVENLALRLQLTAFKRKRKRPVLAQGDRVFWVGISRLWSGWRDALVFVQPDTVVRWQRERFRKFWARLSQSERGRRERPAIAGG